jgi:TorA maturation chaperone TorD
MVFQAAAEQKLEDVLQWSTTFYKQLIDATKENKLEKVAQIAEESFNRVSEARCKIKK